MSMSNFDDAMMEADALVMDTFGVGCRLFAPGAFSNEADPPDPQAVPDTMAIIDLGVAIADEYGSITGYRDEITLPHANVALVGNNGWVVQVISSGKAYRLTTLISTDGSEDRFAAQEISVK